MADNNTIKIDKFASVPSNDLDKIDDILDDDDSMIYIDTNVIDCLFYWISPRFWSPINTTYICYFCDSVANQQNKHLNICACNDCINSIKSNSIDVIEPDGSPVSIKLNSFLRCWIDHNNFTLVSSSSYFDDYKISYDDCYICHKRIHNHPDCDVAIAPEGYAVAHFDCAKMEGFFGYFDSDDYAEILEDMSNIVREIYVPPDGSSTYLDQLNQHLICYEQQKFRYI